VRLGAPRVKRQGVALHKKKKKGGTAKIGGPVKPLSQTSRESVIKPRDRSPRISPECASAVVNIKNQRRRDTLVKNPGVNGGPTAS